MHFVFEVCKLLFFIGALAIALLKWKGADIVGSVTTASTYVEILLPGFFVLAGIMLGWIFAVFFSDGFHPPSGLLMKGFIVGLVLGIAANLLYGTITI